VCYWVPFDICSRAMRILFRALGEIGGMMGKGDQNSQWRPSPSFADDEGWIGMDLGGNWDQSVPGFVA
jgi:hypothetical protein